MSMDSKYLFLRSAEDLAEQMYEKQSKLSNHLYNAQILQRARRAYNYYYGRFFKLSDGSRLNAAGEQNEFVTISVNHFRNILNHLLALLFNNRLSFDTQAESADTNARDACIIGNQILDEQFYDKRIDEQIFRAVEMGLVMGTSFITLEWDPFVKLIGVDESGNPVYTGAPKVRSHSLWDVIWEPFKDDMRDHNWMCIRSIENKWDLVATYPQFEEEIIKLPRISDIQVYDPFYQPEEDHVFIWRCYHKETPAIPAGRMTVFCEGSLILFDGRNPYCHPTRESPNGGLPIFCFRPATHYASSYGHSPAFELMGIQEAINILDSSILTNQDAFAVQNVIVPRESSITTSDLAGGKKMIEYTVLPDVPGGGKPEVLQLCATPAEVFKYKDDLVKQLEVLSGINAVMRGQPQASLISGTALALVASQSQTFNNVLESNFIRLAEDVGHFLLYIISRFQTTEELVSLVGKGKSNEVRSFKGENLDPIRKVKIVLGNPLAKSTAGKVEIAEMLTKNQLIKTPEAVFEALTTGQITNSLDNATSEINYIVWENENLLRNQTIRVIATDNHPQHIMQHRALLFKPDVRQNQQIHQEVLNHIQDHMDQFDQMAAGNPTLLSMIMGTPIPMPSPHPSSGVPGQEPINIEGTIGKPGEIAKSVGAPIEGTGAQTGATSDEQSKLALQAMKSAERKIRQS
jgi:hypothetical protein